MSDHNNCERILVTVIWWAICNVVDCILHFFFTSWV